MTPKQESALQKIITALPKNAQKRFREIAEYAISLGYTPKLMGTRQDYVDFSKNSGSSRHGMGSAWL